MKTRMLVSFSLLLCLSSQAKISAPYFPLGNQAAPKGGVFQLKADVEPATLNPIIADGHDAVQIQFYVIEPLLTRNEETYEWAPMLADKWKILPDKKNYEFQIRPHAMWSDGVPVTAEDVKFSFDVIFNENFPTAHMRPFYESIEKVIILSPSRVRFVAKNDYFGNFFSSAALPIVPKHIYGDPKKGPFIHDTIIGSGAYMFDSWQHGRNIVLKRNPLWWGLKDSLYRGMNNPDTVVFKFIGDENLGLEMLKRGELDFFPLSAEAYFRKTKDPSWGRTIFKNKVENLFPKGQENIVWNLMHPILQSNNVRIALAHLMDRRFIIDRFLYGLALPASGPWYSQSEYADPTVKALEYNPSLALSMLRAEGWEDRNEDGILERKFGDEWKDFEITIFTPSRGATRYLDVFSEDAARIGVKINIRYVSWNQVGQLIDEHKFGGLVSSSSGGVVDFDPKPMWHSSGAIKGGLNTAGYKNKKVDELIDRARKIVSRKKRIPFMRAIYREIAQDAPCLFLFNETSELFALSNRVSVAVPTFKYETGMKYWWMKKDEFQKVYP
jgi:microcin C transport system substrate-binding protein